MSLTAAGFLTFYLTGLVMSVVRHPRYGLYAYLLAFYMHPPDRWWRAEVPDLRWAFIAGLVTLICTVRLKSDQTRAPWYRTGGGLFLIFYLGWMLLQSLWVISPYHQEGVELLAKYTVLYYLIYRLVDSEEEMRNFFLVHVLGSFYLGWLAYGTTVRGRLEGMGGPGIDDANTFGMHVSTAAVFSAALLLRGGKYVRLAVLCAAPFIVNAMILTQSRGAFLGLVAGGLGVFVAKPARKKPVVYLLGALAVILLLMLAPPDFVERMKTITAATDETAEMDGSAASRLEIAKAQLEMFRDYPMGVGHHGTRAISSYYLEEDLLTTNKGGGLARSSHNTLLAALVDQGAPGIMMYLAMLFWVGRTIRDLKRLDAQGLPDALGSYRMSLAGAFALIVIAGMFSNYFRAEVTIWCMALLAALKAQAETTTTAAVESQEASMHGGVLGSQEKRA